MEHFRHSLHGTWISSRYEGLIVLVDCATQINRQPENSNCTVFWGLDGDMWHLIPLHYKNKNGMIPNIVVNTIPYVYLAWFHLQYRGADKSLARPGRK